MRGQRGCVSIKTSSEKAADRLWRLRGAPGASGASPCPESSLHCGGRSSQGPLLIWRPFSSLSHLQVGAHTAKGLLTISALFHPPPTSPPPSPSCLFVLIPHPSISPHRCSPPRMFTISCFHFGAGKFALPFFWQSPFHAFLLCPLWICFTLLLSTSLFSILSSLFFLALLPFPLLPPLLLYLSIYSPADAVPFVLSPMTFLRGIA